MNVKLKEKPKNVTALDPDEAFKKGYFSGSINRNRLMEYLTQRFPELRIMENNTHAGLFDSINGNFICGVPKTDRIPQFTVSKYDECLHPTLPIRDKDGNIVGYQEMNFEKGEGFVYFKSYHRILKALKGAGYEIDENDIMRYCA